MLHPHYYQAYILNDGTGRIECMSPGYLRGGETLFRRHCIPLDRFLLIDSSPFPRPNNHPHPHLFHVQPVSMVGSPPQICMMGWRGSLDSKPKTQNLNKSRSRVIIQYSGGKSYFYAKKDVEIQRTCRYFVSLIFIQSSVRFFLVINTGVYTICAFWVWIFSKQQEDENRWIYTPRSTGASDDVQWKSKSRIHFRANSIFTCDLMWQKPNPQMILQQWKHISKPGQGTHRGIYRVLCLMIVWWHHPGD